MQGARSRTCRKTFYESDDPHCTPIVRAAGQGYLDTGEHAHIARNEALLGSTERRDLLRSASGPAAYRPSRSRALPVFATIKKSALSLIHFH